jgi:hypothetical protein
MTWQNQIWTNYPHAVIDNLTKTFDPNENDDYFERLASAAELDGSIPFFDHHILMQIPDHIRRQIQIWYEVQHGSTAMIDEIVQRLLDND